MSRSLGGLTANGHAVVDALGLQFKIALGERQAYHSHQATALLCDLPLKAMVLRDRAYDTNAIRSRIADQDAWVNIHAMPQRHQKPVLSKRLYKNVEPLERFLNRIRYLRTVATS